jgi:acyl carrier protein
MNDISATLRDFICQNFLFGQPFTLSDEDSLLEHGLIDSTGIMELVAFLEQRYAIAIADDELVPENLDSIDNLVCFLHSKQPSAVVKA